MNFNMFTNCPSTYQLQIILGKNISDVVQILEYVIDKYCKEFLKNSWKCRKRFLKDFNSEFITQK